MQSLVSEDPPLRSSRRHLLFGIGASAVTAAVSPNLGAIPFLRVASPNAEGALDGPIHLDRNENPYGPSDLAIAAIRDSLGAANRYSDDAGALRAKIARFHKVDPEQVVLGCGSSEVLQMAAEAFLSPGKKLVMATPSYPLLASYARAKGIEVVKIPLTSAFTHDLQGMLARSDSSTGLIYICNPNDPTGNVTVRDEIEEFLGRLPSNIPVIIDEAYHEYVNPSTAYASFIDRPIHDGRTIVTRTFSKVYGLAGLRIGYGVAPAEMARRLAPFRLQPENTLAIKAAMAALDDQDHVRRSVQRNADQRQEFWNKANVRMVNVTESLANFVLVHLDLPSDQLVAHFSKNNILVAHDVGMDGFVRVSIGRPDELDAFWRVWDMLPHHFMHK
jgi:histidinol-phosphate aminotransferase